MDAAETRVLAFDLETTGISWTDARIVEFSFLELDPDLRELGAWTRRVRPDVPIPPEASDVHGITDADVAGERPLAFHARRIQDLVQDAVLVAYNAKFDVNILHHALQRAGQPGFEDHPAVVDPWRIFRERLDHNAYRLGDAVKVYLREDLQDAHGALADARATVRVLRSQRQVHPGLAKPLADIAARDHVLLADVAWLGDGTRFYRADDGVVRFNFGRHEDEPAREHPDYLRWMLTKDFGEGDEAVVRQLLEEAAGP